MERLAGDNVAGFVQSLPPSRDLPGDRRPVVRRLVGGGLVMGMAIPCPKGDNVLVCFFLRNAAIGMVIILAAVLLVACFASWCMNRVAREREAPSVFI